MTPTATTSQIVAQMRARPGMYIGRVDSRGIEQIAGELIANSLDLFLAGKASRIAVAVHKNNSITVSDDGPGFDPGDTRDGGVSLAEYYLTHLHQTATADGHAPHIHLTPSGIGMVIVNALSSKLTLRSRSGGCLREVIFRRGERCSSRTVPTAGGRQGITITFMPDAEIFGKHRVCRQALRRLLFHAAHLFPGVRIQFGSECFYAPGGLGDLTGLFASDSGPRFGASLKTESCFIHTAAAGSGKETVWQSWVNGQPTPYHGTHVKAFKEALSSAGWVPESAMIHVIMRQPRYAGPTKGTLEVPEIRSEIRSALLPVLRTVDLSTQS